MVRWPGGNLTMTTQTTKHTPIWYFEGRENDPAGWYCQRIDGDMIGGPFATRNEATMFASLTAIAETPCNHGAQEGCPRLTAQAALLTIKAESEAR
jgi:hypothetical protein